MYYPSRVFFKISFSKIKDNASISSVFMYTRKVVISTYPTIIAKKKKHFYLTAWIKDKVLYIFQFHNFRLYVSMQYLIIS